MDDGSYIVFVELDRNEQLAENVMSLLEDMMNLTEQSPEDWRVRYYKSHKETQLSLESLQQLIPDTPEKYESLYGQEAIDQLKTAAGIDVNTRAPKNDFTESLRNLANIPR
jgi:hypothetical protein